MPVPSITGIACSSLTSPPFPRKAKSSAGVGRQEADGSIFFNQSHGKTLHFKESFPSDGKGKVYDVALGDLDRDGCPNIVAARSEAPNAIYYGHLKPPR